MATALRGLSLLRLAHRAPRVGAQFGPSFAGGYAPRFCARTFAAKGDPSEVIAPVKPTPPGEMPSTMDQATGLERAEVDHPDLFKHNEVLRGEFGTEENPVLIQSAYDSRIVGCTGQSPPDDHDIVWLTVKKGSLTTCDVCGQVFKLDPL